MSKAIMQLNSWLLKKGWQLRLEKDLVWECDGEIQVVRGDPKKLASTRLNRHGVAALITHECGHIIDYESKLTSLPWSDDDELPDSFSSELAPDSWYIEVVAREFRAWDLGLRLARNLKLAELSKIEAAAKKLRQECMYSYIDLASKRGPMQNVLKVQGRDK